eukprot:COSAG02_NODE_904_length_16045_cov_3920.854697_7_plen_138_part_00
MVLAHLSKLDFATEFLLTHTDQTEHEELLTSGARASTEFRASTDLRLHTYTTLTAELLHRQAHKIFVGGLPQNVTEGELLKYFEKAGGSVADVLILKVRLTTRSSCDIPGYVSQWSLHALDAGSFLWSTSRLCICYV